MTDARDHFAAAAVNLNVALSDHYERERKKHIESAEGELVECRNVLDRLYSQQFNDLLKENVIAVEKRLASLQKKKRRTLNSLQEALKT